MTDENQPPVPPQQPAAPTPPPPPAAPQYQAAPPAPGYQAAPPAGGYQPAPVASVPGKSLGIAGLITAIAGFFIFPIVAPIAGLIMSIIARNQSKAAGVPNSPAKAGIIVAIIAIVLAIIGIIIFVVVIASVVAQCADLGTGVHELDGRTYTCS